MENTPFHNTEPENFSPWKAPKKRLIALGLFALIFAGASVFGTQIGSRLGATITEGAVPSGTHVYIPAYTAAAGDEGTIDVKTQATLNAFDSISFTLNYTPVDALSFDQSPIVFDATTEFQSAAFQIATSPEPGKLVVTIIRSASAGVTDPGADPTLFRLKTKISSDVSVGQVIDFSVSDLVMLNGVNIANAGAMVTGDMTIVGGTADLRVLSAEAIDANHVAVQFSDFVSNLGSTADYTIREDGDTTTLSVSAVESGTAYGYDQTYAVLTTANQSAVQRYTISVDDATQADPDVTGNSKGTVSTTYNDVVFYGFGTASTSLSDFGMVSASAPTYNTVTVTFTDNVDAASVTKSDFTLTQIGAGALTISNVASVTNNQVTLTVDTGSAPLLTSANYLLTASSASAILRAGDGASMGIREVSFSGQKNGPRIISANVTESGGQYTATITFDENIELSGTAQNPVGYIYTTAAGDSGTLINDTVAGTWNQTISGKTLTLTNATFNAPNTNFTFSVGTNTWLENSMDAPVDAGYKSVSFWGYGHSATTNTLGNVTVTRKDVITVKPGTSGTPLDFDQVNTADVTLLYDDGSGTLQSHSVSSVTVLGGDLEVTATTPFSPNVHYTVRIVDNPTANNTLNEREFALEQGLSLESAVAINGTQVRLTFSESIDERSVTSADFTLADIGGSGVAVSAAVIEAGYRDVLLTTAGVSAGTIYHVTAGTDVYAFSGKALFQNTTVFEGYQTVAGQSPVVLQSAQATSSNTVRLTFSGAMDQSTLTPLNIAMYSVTSTNPLVTAALTVTGVTQVSASVYDVSTSVHTADLNYFVVLSNVKDSNGLLLSNTKTLNFLGYTVPTPSVNTTTPSSVSNDADQTVILSGKNLNTIQSARLGTQDLTISDQPASGTSLSLVIPSGTATGNYNITLTDASGSLTTVTNALQISEVVTPLQVVSASSKGIPFNVPNDGTTKTTLWVLVQDAADLANVSSVSVDLRQIGGSGTQEMKKDTGPQPEGGQWYTYETVVSPNTATRETPYSLPVEVRKGNQTVSGAISLKVTKNVFQSVAPTVDQIYASPVSVSPDGKTPVRISAQISDADGAQTITSVTADLGPLGLGFVLLSPLGEVMEGQELTTRFYQSDEFTVPQTTATGDYTINIVVSDETGESTTASTTLSVSTQLTGPTIDDDISYIAPRQSLPNDEKTPFSLHVYITDPDGISDVDTVTAHFGIIGLPPASLVKGSDVGESAKSAWFSVSGLVMPKTAPIGVHRIEIRAVDKSGGQDNLIIQVDVTHKDTLGDAPRIVGERNYSTPRVAVNDGQTPVTLYAFVRDDDSDINSVVANLSQIGQVGPETGAFAESAPAEGSGGNCPTGSNVLVCMNPSIKEGDNGQWFILPDVTISSSTAPSPQAYAVDVIVTDITGKTSRGTIPVYVSDGNNLESNQKAPQIVTVVPTGPNSVEVLFNKEIAASSLSPNGSGFTIADRNNIFQTLAITGVTINATGDLVTLTTGPQIPGKPYVLTGNKEIKDAIGLSLVEGIGSRIPFTGFVEFGKVPVVDYIDATDVDTIEIEFQDDLKPSSVKVASSTLERELSSRDLNITIYESEDSSKKLAVKSVRFLDAPNILEVKTAPQKGGQRYRVNIEGIASYDGTPSTTTITKTVKGFNLKTVVHQAATNQADLNGDGRVDFSDFTIFSSVYGTSYLNSDSGGEAGNATGQALEEDPDATVPVTSEAGKNNSNN